MSGFKVVNQAIVILSCIYMFVSILKRKFKTSVRTCA